MLIWIYNHRTTAIFLSQVHGVLGSSAEFETSADLSAQTR